MPGKAEGPAAAAGREARRRAQEALRCARFSELRTFNDSPAEVGGLVRLTKTALRSGTPVVSLAPNHPLRQHVQEHVGAMFDQLQQQDALLHVATPYRRRQLQKAMSRLEAQIRRREHLDPSKE
jgi:hypothetical protein